MEIALIENKGNKVFRQEPDALISNVAGRRAAVRAFQKLFC
jgi:hypothetical protein